MPDTYSLGDLSTLFRIKTTSLGGRECYSSTALKKGDIVLEASDSMGASIAYDFRKEVCHYCYSYHNGRNLKFKLDYQHIEHLLSDEQCSLSSNKKKFLGAGLWFCTEDCRTKFLAQPHIIELIQCYELLLVLLKMMQKKSNPEIYDEQKMNSIDISKAIVDSTWLDIEKNWVPNVNRMKPAKKLMQLPFITEDEYICARFVCKTLFHLKHLDPKSSTIKAFKMLQSNEISKLNRFPILLSFQVLVFKTLFILLPDCMRENFSVQCFRHVLGSEYGNAFGIWQLGESCESREYLGYCVFPRASYFNHSCDPNVTKTRVGRSMVFTLNKDVGKDVPLCIDYSGILNLPTVERRQCLRENWFFDCLCDRCKSELQSIH